MAYYGVDNNWKKAYGYTFQHLETVPEDAYPNGELQDKNLNLIDLKDKYERKVMMNSQQRNTYDGICKIDQNQLIACYGKFESEVYGGGVSIQHSYYELVERCCDCPYACHPHDSVSLERKIYEKSIFRPTFIYKKWKDKLSETDDRSDWGGIVYFITDGEYVKIGVTNDVKKRISGIQTGNAREIKCLFIIPCKKYSFAEEMEKWLHQKYDVWRMNGEWFNILKELDLKHFQAFFDGYNIDLDKYFWTDTNHKINFYENRTL